MKKENEAEMLREVAGAFFELDKLQDAVDELLACGFRGEAISMLASEYTVRESLGDYYTRINQFSTSPDAPKTAFVAKESMGDTMHALFGSLFFLGATVAAGAVVISAGAFAGALTAAVAGSTVIAGIGAVLATIIHESDAEEIEQQIDEGHLVLFVRAANDKQEALATKILSKHAATDVKIYNVKSRTG